MTPKRGVFGRLNPTPPALCSHSCTSSMASLEHKCQEVKSSTVLPGFSPVAPSRPCALTPRRSAAKTPPETFESGGMRERLWQKGSGSGVCLCGKRRQPCGSPLLALAGGIHSH
jgi:hypothetical protein